jgi:D-glycero-alpha-D-manno-heptose 1-phosphate guanylyltransferase
MNKIISTDQAVPGSPFTGRGGQAIILAGGLGTRLRSAVPDLPKCMAPVAGRPFLFHVINSFRLQGVEHFIFSLGYKHEIMEEYLADQFSRLSYECVIEAEPLGTGGAIHLAMQKATTENVIVTNGDTLFNANLTELMSLHLKKQAACTLALKPMKKFDRYGVVEIDKENTITSFLEKKYYDEGLINGGLYIINKEKFLQQSFPQKFSFEKDYLEPSVSSGKLSGLAQDHYFIDIGIPEDFEKAQKDLQHPPLDLKAIDKSWTLFLDRDGVINTDKPGSYIFNTDEFSFMEGLPAAFKKLTQLFKHVIVITNQRGVGRELMKETDLTAIHEKMKAEAIGAGGKIDGISYCTSIHNNHPDRKPNPGMAVQAVHDFPGIDLRRSIMIGNNLSDMQFGRNAGMYTIFVKTTNPLINLPHPDIDLLYNQLADFVKAL